MKRKRIRCFVAMPFSREDCDGIYRHKILPTLKSLNIDPIRVDQREHKEDLNVYIIKMLDESDLALVDLTYARPSVYYEAGYAEREIPVVYTVRADHLSRAQPDDRLRVHFDLEMKKIVSWRNVSDSSFANRLERRIKYLIRPLSLAIRRDESLAKSRDAFNSKSVKARIEEISRSFRAALEARRFWTASIWDINKRIATNFLPGEVIVGAKMIDRTCHFCAVVIEASLEKKIIRSAVNGPLPRYIMHEEGIDEYKGYYFLCALQKFKISRIASIFPDAVSASTPGTYTFCDTPPYKWSKKIEKTIRVMPTIDSYVALRDFAKTSQSLLPLERTNRFTYKSSVGEEANFISFVHRPKPKR